MLGSTILDVAIGVVFIFVLISTVCAAIREVIETKLKTRAAYLERGIRELLHDREGKGLAQSFFNHPLIFSLYSGKYDGALPSNNSAGKPKLFARGGGLPSYIPSRNFALALLDIAARGPSTDLVNSDAAGPELSLANARASILNISNPAVQRVLLTAIDTAQGDLNLAQRNIEAWYDSAMDRVSGWYKRSTQWVIFLIALSLAGLLNINTLVITDHLYRDDTMREALVARAGRVTESGTATVAADKAADELRDLKLPMGWSEGLIPGARAHEIDVWDVSKAVFGILITAFAATVGAPFWFDLLNKMMVIRSTVKPREKSQEEGSEDRTQSSPQSSLARVLVTQAPSPPQAGSG